MLLPVLTGTVVVTGTGTDIGKTMVTAALAASARMAGRSVAIVKPLQTGLPGSPGSGGGDAQIAAELANTCPGQVEVSAHELIRLPDPLAPDLAARRAGMRLPPVESHVPTIEILAKEHDLVLVEGAGGLLVRLDGAGGTLADLARLLAGSTTIVVVSSGLGSLNHSELTVEALRNRGIRVAGLVIGSWPEQPDLAELENLSALTEVTGLPLLGRLPAGFTAADLLG